MRPACLGWVVLAACGGDAGGSVRDAGPTADAVPSEVRFGAAPALIQVIDFSDQAGGAFAGQAQARLADAAEAFYVEDVRDGACRLLRSELSFCERPCDGQCTSGGVCVPYPQARSAGPLNFEGLTTGVTLPFSAGSYETWYGEGALQSVGDDVTVSAPGDELGPIDLAAPAPEPLSITNLEDLAPEPSPLSIRWEPSNHPGARIRLFLRTDAGHAQTAPLAIECDVADVGELTVPGAMMTEYVRPENWSCGDCIGSTITRYRHADGVLGEIAVELRIGSQVALYLPVY